MNSEQLTSLLRTSADLCDTIKQAFQRFTLRECRNSLMATGYDAFDPT